MDSFRNISTQWNIRVEESNLIEYGSIHDELHWSFIISLETWLAFIYLLNMIVFKFIPTTSYEI